MKKTMAVLMVVAVAGVASADLAVNAKNQTPLVREGFTSIGPGQGLEAGAYVQLLWKADNAGYQSDDLAESLLNPGEYLLRDGYADNVGLFNLTSSPAFTDADVGGADVNTGYFYARIFERGTVAPGDFFLEMGIQGPTLTEFDPLVAPSTYSLNMGLDVAEVWIDSQGTTVVPEPATIGLMGIAGLGLVLARRKARR
jgi:hypothetical protein